MSETISKTIHYKRAVLTDGEVLQDVLAQVFVSGGGGHLVGARKEVVNADSNTFRVINRIATHGGMMFGQLIMLEPGKSQAYVELDDSAESYALDALTNVALNLIPAQVSSAEKIEHRKEFVDSILYFGVFESHLILMQSQSLRSRELEAHLGWLIGKFGGLRSGSALILQDQPSQETMALLKTMPVKSIHLGTPVEAYAVDDSGQVTATTLEQDETTKARTVKFVPKGMGASLLSIALGEKWFESLRLEDDLDDANLQVSLEVTYMRKTTKTGQRVMDNIATTLRHVDEADIKVELLGGGRMLSGGQIRLSGQVSVSKLANGLYDEGVLYQAMQSWLSTKLQSNEVEAGSGGEL